MALKFLNKKGWHTGSLRNIENVWKAEQKHEAEQKKLEELRLQIQQERERSEFRALQEQAGLAPRQERLEFLYDSGLSVGKGSSSSSGAGVSFQALEQPAKADASSSGDNKQQQPSVPGALFEDKLYSANDAWRKLHSDPLLLIRQREQEALARIKNNPMQMALIRKSVEEKKPKEKDGGKKEHRKKHRHSNSKHQTHSSSRHHSDSEEDSAGEDNGRKSHHHEKSRGYEKHHERRRSDSEDDKKKRESHVEIRHRKKYRVRSPSHHPDREYAKSCGQERRKRRSQDLDHEKRPSKGLRRSDTDRNDKENGRSHENSGPSHDDEPLHRRRNVAPKLSEEERAARLQQMQMDAELHEEQRWKRLKKAEEVDAKEAKQNSVTAGKSFLDAAHKSVYGAEKGGSSTIEESVRRRTHYLQRGSETEGNAFRR